MQGQKDYHRAGDAHAGSGRGAAVVGVVFVLNCGKINNIICEMGGDTNDKKIIY